jgi:hypothetical protein
MRRQDLPLLLKSLQAVAKLVDDSDTPFGKFSYALVKNINLVDSECRTTASRLKIYPDFQEYEQDRAELATKFSDTNEDGSPKTEGEGRERHYVIPESNKDAFATALQVLGDEHKAALDARTQQIEDFKLYVVGESELELFRITHTVMPEELKPAQIQSIWPIFL